MANMLFGFEIAYASLVVGTMIKLIRIGLRGPWVLIAIPLPFVPLLMPMFFFPIIRWFVAHRSDRANPMILIFQALGQFPLKQKVILAWGLGKSMISNYPSIAAVTGHSVIAALKVVSASEKPIPSRVTLSTVAQSFLENMVQIAQVQKYPAV